MGKVNLRYYPGRDRPWRAQWTEAKGGKSKSRTKWFKNDRNPPPKDDMIAFEALSFRRVDYFIEIAKIEAVKKAYMAYGVIPERALFDFKAAHEEEGEKYGAIAIPDGDREKWWRICERCEEVGKTPEEVIEEGIKAIKNAVAKSEPIETALGLWGLDATARNLRPDTIRNIRHAVGAFSRGRQTTLVSDFTAQQIQQWVAGRYSDQDSRDSMLARLLTFFRWCAGKDRRWARADSFADVKWENKVKNDKKRVSFYTAAEAQALLNEVADNLKPALALGFFTGLRPFEMNRVMLSLQHDGEFYGFDPKHGDWHIAPFWAKTRAYRKLYSLPDCWWFWWEKYKNSIAVTANNRRKAHSRVGKLVPMNYRNFRVALGVAHQRAGVLRSPKDGIRHSFGTHGYHRSDDGGSRGMEWTIALMGHTGGYRVFEKRYNGKCSSREAEAYFLIYPAGAACEVKTRKRIFVEPPAEANAPIQFPSDRKIGLTA
jgi:hypothetical protein